MDDDEQDGGPVYNASELRERREALGLSQQGMSLYMGLSLRGYQALESGAKPVKRSHMMMLMATQFLMVGADGREELVGKIDLWLISYARAIAKAADAAKIKSPKLALIDYGPAIKALQDQIEFFSPNGKGVNPALSLVELRRQLSVLEKLQKRD